MAAQFTLTNGYEERRERLCIARATSSLPVPVSPVIRTVESVAATLDTREITGWRAGEVPTISSNIDALSISSRSATFSCRSLSSDRLRLSILVAVAYHLITCPSSPITELYCIRNHRYCPFLLRTRCSFSNRSPRDRKST